MDTLVPLCVGVYLQQGPPPLTALEYDGKSCSCPWALDFARRTSSKMTRLDEEKQLHSGCLPELVGTTQFPDKENAISIWDVSFYPYTEPGVAPVFAFPVGRKVVVCRIHEASEKAIEVMRWFEDADGEVELHDLAWSQDPHTGDPLVCVAGAKPPKIKVLNVNTGKLVKTLTGHGERINGLVASPESPHIIASGSEDNTIRLWDLTTANDDDACKALLAGGGHRLGLYSLAFHRNGRYLLSGGLDTAINLWVTPDIGDTNLDDDKHIVKDRGVSIIYYPHFSTTEVHGDHVDCVEFYNDLVISKSAREPYILLWQIVGFSSSRALPPRAAAPTASTTTTRTRSAFAKSDECAFQVLLRFDMPNCQWAWCHFGLFHTPHAHPLLIMGSDSLWISIWDLQLIEEGILGTVIQKPPTKIPLAPETSDEKFGVSRKELMGPFELLKPHKMIRLPNVGFGYPCYTVRHFSFSTGGEWCVAVGDCGMLSVLRWRDQGKKLKKR